MISYRVSTVATVRTCYSSTTGYSSSTRVVTLGTGYLGPCLAQCLGLRVPPHSSKYRNQAQVLATMRPNHTTFCNPQLALALRRAGPCWWLYFLHSLRCKPTHLPRTSPIERATSPPPPPPKQPRSSRCCWPMSASIRIRPRRTTRRRCPRQKTKGTPKSFNFRSRGRRIKYFLLSKIHEIRQGLSIFFCGQDNSRIHPT